jgi:hypothetical protein
MKTAIFINKACQKRQFNMQDEVVPMFNELYIMKMHEKMEV